MLLVILAWCRELFFRLFGQVNCVKQAGSAVAVLILLRVSEMSGGGIF